MASKKLIILSGGPCVGKSTVGQKIFEHYVNSAFCNGDWCWCVNPYSIEDKRLRNGDKNMAFLISTYLNSGFEYVVFSSVVMTDPDARENILRAITADDYEIMSFQLVCTEDTLKMRKDASGVKKTVSFFWLELPPYPGEIVIHTDGKTPDQVCKEICKHIDAAVKAEKEKAKAAKEAAKAEPKTEKKSSAKTVKETAKEPKKTAAKKTKTK
ncbi:MAG: hypothetical protein J5845_02785 [Lachnospiraceae bacterium]|nr:hypothetical protein [Lachnospiraceae bacterium]